MIKSYAKKLTAITLCIVLIMSTLCTFACVTDEDHNNMQFFAVDFSKHNSGGSTQSLSGNNEARIVTWLRNPEIVTENQILSPDFKTSVSFSADKLLGVENFSGEDLYNEFKITEYRLRI